MDIYPSAITTEFTNSLFLGLYRTNQMAFRIKIKTLVILAANDNNETRFLFTKFNGDAFTGWHQEEVSKLVNGSLHC